MDVPFNNIGVTNLILDDVLEGEGVDVINADCFDNDFGNDDETSNYRRTRHKLNNAKEAKESVYLHSIESKRNLKLYKNNSVKVRARCDGKVPVFTMSQGIGSTGPNHRMEVGLSGSSGLSTRSKKRKNTSTNDDRDTHKYLQSKEIKQRIYKFLPEKIFDQVRVNLEILVKAVQAQLQHDLELQISMRKAFRAKAKAEREIKGDDVLSIKTSFRAYKRDLLGLDGAFMKGLFPGQVLAAVGLDLNNGIYLLAYALVEAETIITMFPSAEQRYCLRHIHENMKHRWCRQAYKDLLWGSASATSVKEFEKCLRKKYHLSLKNDMPPRDNMDVPFNNIGVTNLVLDDVLEGEGVDVINADCFDNNFGNDDETSNYRRRRHKLTNAKEAKESVYLHSIKSKRNLKLYKNNSVKVRARCDGKVPVFTMSQGIGSTGPNHRMEVGLSGSSGLSTRSKKRKNTSTNDDRWCGQAYTDLLWESASTTSVKEFEKCMLELKKMNPKAHEWLNKIPPEHYARSHFSVTMIKVIKGEFEKLDSLMINDVSLTCNTSLEIFNEEFNRMSRMDNDLFTYEVEIFRITNIPCDSNKEDDSEQQISHKADDDMEYDPSDVEFTKWLALKIFNYKMMDHYTKNALWIYWVRGNDEVKLTNEESLILMMKMKLLKSLGSRLMYLTSRHLCVGPSMRAYTVGNTLRYQDLEWYEALKDGKLKDEALKNKAIMEGIIKDDDDELSNEERCELFDDHERPGYNIKRFDMIKYSFGQDEEYLAVKEDEYDV
nr:hypothetical protein [Tanacetum cinerariifolium]